MQETRRQILNILKEKGQATVDSLAAALGLTPITVRHHLSILQSEGYIVARHERRKVGRPHYVFVLTEKANDFFPQSYHLLADRVLAEVQSLVGREQMATLFRRIAHRLVADVKPRLTGETLEQRLDEATRLLADEGFLARWEKTADGYVIYELNCPYRRVVREHEEICIMDHQILSDLLDVPVEKVECIVTGGSRCTYRIPTTHMIPATSIPVLDPTP